MSISYPKIRKIDFLFFDRKTCKISLKTIKRTWIKKRKNVWSFFNYHVRQNVKRKLNTFPS